jgi:hypothetical protein
MRLVVVLAIVKSFCASLRITFQEKCRATSDDPPLATPPIRSAQHGVILWLCIQVPFPIFATSHFSKLAHATAAVQPDATFFCNLRLLQPVTRSVFVRPKSGERSDSNQPRLGLYDPQIPARGQPRPPQCPLQQPRHARLRNPHRQGDPLHPPAIMEAHKVGTALLIRYPYMLLPRATMYTNSR